MTLRIAMWSGPRNISTAMMRAWENRPDTVVWDEPFYAHYLKATGRDHPGRDEVLAHHESDPRKIAEQLLGPLPEGRTIFYQKHMSHHLLPDAPRGWVNDVTNCFLIRDPREMLTSLVKNIPNPGIEETGLPQQVEIFEQVRESGDESPPVLDARDVLSAPEQMLRRLCDWLGVPFSEAMLSWPAGPRETDGVWARYWYDSVWKSTGFEPYRPKSEPVPARLRPLLEECMHHYEHLHAQRLRP